MKKVMILLAAAAIMTSCGNSDFESVCDTFEDLKQEQKEEKQNANFRIFNDHYNRGKGETR